MPVNVIDNFSYRGSKYLDSRTTVASLAELRSISETDVPERFKVLVHETGRWYEYGSGNTPDAETGRWREVAEVGALASALAELQRNIDLGISHFDGYQAEGSVPDEGIWYSPGTQGFVAYGSARERMRAEAYNQRDGRAREDKLFGSGQALYKYDRAIGDLVEVTRGSAGEATFSWDPSTATLEIFTN